MDCIINYKFCPCIFPLEDIYSLNSTVRSLDDCIYMINALEYKKITDIPYELFNYFVVCDDYEKKLLYAEYPGEDNIFMNKLHMIKSHCPMKLFVKYNYLDCVCLYDKYNSVMDMEILLIAAKYGRLECIIYLISVGHVGSIRVTNTAARYGHVNCLEYLIKYGCNADTASLAAEFGHIDCLIYLHSISQLFDRHAAATAAGVGNLKCLKFLHRNNYKVNISSVISAISNNKVECLEYLIDINIPLTFKSFLLAAKKDNDCLHLICNRFMPSLF